MSYTGSTPHIDSIISSGDTLANLTARTREAGTFVYATDTKQFYYDDGTDLIKSSGKEFSQLPPTVSIFDSTQRSVNPIGVTTGVLTVSLWLQFNPADTDQQVFMMDAEGVPWQLWWQPNANILSFNWDNTVIDFVSIDAEWHHYVCVYNSVDGELDLFVDGERRGRAPIVGALAFTPAMLFRIASYDDVDDDWFLDGKIANFEIWDDVLDLADARALYQAGYYQDPKSIITKSLLNHYLMGDNEQDTVAFIKDNEGSSDLNWVDSLSAPSSVTFNTVDIPTKQVVPVLGPEVGLKPTSTVFTNGNFDHAVASFPSNTDTVSFSTWVELNTPEASQGILLVDGGGLDIQLIWQAAGVSFWINGAATQPIGNLVSDGEWHHLIGVYQKVNPLIPAEGIIEMFLDGALVGTQAVLTPPSITAGMEVQIGNSVDGSTAWGFEGRMSNFEIWTSALDAADALALYEAGYYQDPEALVAKTLSAHYLMGSNPLDSVEILKDNKGVEDAVWQKSTNSTDSYNLPLPAPVVGGGGFDAVDTLANLTALPRAEGKIYYATDTDLVYTDDGVSLNVVAGGGVPLMAKGSLLTSDGGGNGELGVGGNEQVLVADSAEVPGLKWANASPLTAKGDLYTYDTANQKLAIGANTHVLTADSTQPTGMKWAPSTGGGGSSSILTTVTIQDDFKYTFNETSSLNKELYRSSLWEFVIAAGGGNSIECAPGDGIFDGIKISTNSNGTNLLRITGAYDFKSSNAFTFATRVIIPDNAPDGLGDKPVHYIGLENTTGGDSFWFKWSYQDSYQVQVLSKQGGVLTQESTGVVPTSNLFMDLRIEYDGAGNTTYYVDDVLTNTIVGTEISNTFDINIKSEQPGGSNIQTFSVDYVLLEYTR
jgi:hypothetical protein